MLGLPHGRSRGAPAGRPDAEVSHVRLGCRCWATVAYIEVVVPVCLHVCCVDVVEWDSLVCLL
jgi:hypothetical protein